MRLIHSVSMSLSVQMFLNSVPAGADPIGAASLVLELNVGSR